MNETVRKLLRDRDTVAFLVVDVIVGALVAFFSWIINDDPATALLWAMGGTAFLWIMTIRVQLGLQRFDTEERLQSLQHALEETVEIKLDALADRELSQCLRTIAGGMAASTKSLEEPFKSFSRTAVKEFARTMALLERGEVKVSSDVAWHWSLKFLETSKTLFATTFSSRNSYWSSQSGLQYLDVNIKAAERGAKITRVFVLDGFEDEHLIKNVVKKHVANNMEVWIVKSDDLDPLKLVDIAVFDDRTVSIWSSVRPNSDIESVLWSQTEDSLSTYQSLRSYYSYRAYKIHTEQALDDWQRTLAAPVPSRS